MKNKTVISKGKAFLIATFSAITLTLTGVAVSPAMAQDTETLNLTALVPEIFEVSFDFFSDPDPTTTDESGTTDHWLPLAGGVFNFGLTWPGMTTDDDGDEIAMPMRSSEVVRVQVGVINTTGNQYTISHGAVQPLTGPIGSQIDGAFIVSAFVDPGDGRDQSLGTGTTTTKVTSKQDALYTSDASGTSTVVQIVYGVSGGFDENGDPISGVDINDLVDIDTVAGNYATDITLTVQSN